MTPAAVITLRVVPRASRNEAVIEADGALKIRLQAPPVEGKANQALVDFLSDRLDIPRRRITILAGQTGRTKRIRIDGLSDQSVRQALSGR